MAKEKLLPPKETVHEKWEVRVPAGAEGPLAVEAVLRYRAAPQEVMDGLFGKGKFDLRIVDMATARTEVPLSR
jgi:hypothetical protein